MKFYRNIDSVLSDTSLSDNEKKIIIQREINIRPPEEQREIMNKIELTILNNLINQSTNNRRMR